MTSRKDSAYVNGVIAVREKKLLKDKLVRACSMSEEEALRTFFESGFGGGDFSLDAEGAILADEREIDAFIREYSPSREVTEYLLVPRDFHNAKAIVKARHLNTDPAPLIGSEGKFSVSELTRLIEGADYSALGAELGSAVKAAEELLAIENPSGAQVGFLFDKALFDCLAKATKKFGACRKLLVRRVDMLNLLTYFRSESEEQAKEYFLAGGSLKADALSTVFAGTDEALKKFDRSDYYEFVKKLCAAKEGGMPYTEAEKMLESCELDFFAEKPYELSGQGTFLYYIFRRRTENENVRIVLVGLRAGLSESELKKRLRGKV